ncbi:MAG: RNA methyltransferase [Deltaproteobacteria bacterium]|nr:RNA methyltransferase [Deltaproteobacteria bacterium]
MRASTGSARTAICHALSPVHVSSADDPRLDLYRALKGDHRRRPHFVAESDLAVRRLLGSDLAVDSVLCTPAHLPRIVDAVPEHVALLVAEEALIAEVAGFPFHRGCLAAGRRPAPAPPDLARFAALPRARIVIAENLVDPANVGALLRNCRAFRTDLVLLDARAADPFSRRAIRASLGHSFTQPLALVPDLLAEAHRLRDLGLTLLAATVSPDARPITTLAPPPRLALLLGNESSGLSPSLLSLAHQRVTIPIDPSADSLNVASATAILLHWGTGSTDPTR